MKFEFNWESLQKLTVNDLKGMKEDIQELLFSEQREKDQLVREILWLNRQLNPGATEITCSGAGQCDHDGVGCTKDNNCGEYRAGPE